MPQPVIQDTVEFAVRADETVINNTVKLVATVVAMVAGDITEEALRSDVKSTMKKLVDADWQFANMQRNADDSGFERVTLNASVRVPETENYNLDNRAKEASRRGLSITQVDVDTSVPQTMLDEAESKLRITLIQKVRAETDKLEAVIGTKDGYRIHQLKFAPVQTINTRGASSNQYMLSASASSSVSKTSYGTGFNDDETLGNASKLSMQVTVILARHVRIKE